MKVKPNPKTVGGSLKLQSRAPTSSTPSMPEAAIIHPTPRKRERDVNGEMFYFFIYILLNYGTMYL